MVKQVENEVMYYYDFHPTLEDLMGETAVHAALVHYLMEVLTWLFRGQLCAIHENLNFYQTLEEDEQPLAPDIAVIKGVAYEYIRSWKVWQTGIVPHVVFEIASQETWKRDLEEKPLLYAQMGVQEYFAYDPNEPPLRKKTPCKLYGWQLNKARGVMREMPIGPDGSLWSSQLDSFLVPDGVYLRLYNSYGKLRLTRAEAEAEGRWAEAQRAEAAIRQAEEERKRNEALAEKLRSLGIDPDQI